MSLTFNNIPQIFKEGTDKENMPIYPKKLSIVDYARNSAKHKSFGESNATRNTADMNFTCQDFHSRHFSQTAIDMELTCCKPEEPNDNEILTQNTDSMKTSKLINISCQDGHFNQLDDMEITCQLSKYNCQMDTSKIHSNQTVKNHTKHLSDDMELTNINCQMSYIQQDDEENHMELTCKALETSNYNCEDSPSKAQTHRTINKEIKHSLVEMELTCQLPGNMDLSCNSPTVKDNSKQSLVNMESGHVNCQMPDATQNVVRSITCKSPPQSNCQEGKISSSKIVEEDNRHPLMDMEFTCQIPNINCQIPEANKSKNVMDFSLSSPLVLSKSNCPILKEDNRHSLVAMDWSCPTQKTICMTNTSSQEYYKTLSNVNTQYDLNESDNMEFTCQVPKIFNITLEPSCQIPSLPNSDQDRKTNRLTFNKAESKELDCDYIEPMEISPVKKTLTPDVNCQTVNTPRKSIRNNFERSPSIISFNPSTKSGFSSNKRIENRNQNSRLNIPSLRLNFSEKENFIAQMSQLNFTNISSGVDDTQHLIHCTFTNSVLNEQSRQQFTPPKIPETDSSDFDETNIEGIRSNSKLANVNDTYALRFKKNSSLEVESLNSSLGIIENLGDCEDITTYCKKKYTLEKIEFSVKSRDRIKALNIETMARRPKIKEFFGNFQYEPIIVPNEFILKKESLSDCESLNGTEEEIIYATKFTLEERIKEKQVR